jgi:hypothetical protein
MIEGYIISNRDWTRQVQLEMGISSFGKTAAQAWRRHINKPDDKLNFPIYVQRWSDMGYIPIKVKVEIVKEIT